MPRITTGKKRSAAQIEATRLMGHSAHEEPAIVVPALAENVSANVTAESAHAGPSVGDHTLIELMQTLALKDVELQAKDAVINAQHSALKSTKIQLDQSQTEAEAAQERADKWYAAYRVDHKKASRTKIAKEKLGEQLAILKSLKTASEKDMGIAFNLLQEQNDNLEESLAEIIEDCASEALRWKKRLVESRDRVRALQMRSTRAPAVQEKAIQKAIIQLEKDETVYKLMEKGVYTPQARALARTLVTAGCTQDFVGVLIQKICGTVGVTVEERMSRHTVARAVAEGGIAAKMQLAYELAEADSFTASSDATTHKHTEVVARHINLVGEDGKHHSKLLGVHPAADHSSQAQLDNWKKQITEIADIFNRSPMAKRSRTALKYADFIRDLKGLNGDHAGDQKKLAQLLKDLKEELALQTLGSEKLVEMTASQRLSLLMNEHKKKVALAGGEKAWDAFSDEEKAVYNNEMLKDLTRDLGEAAYDKLSDHEKAMLNLFVWVGCCMHKDLNSVKGGNKDMMAWWGENDVQGPIRLANRDNAAVLSGMIETVDSTTPAEKRAMDVTACGGVKAASIAGAIFNNKDDKKGYQDAHKRYFEPITGKWKKFPDTSNTRYQSYSEAAAELITYRKEYIDLLTTMRLCKIKKVFNHMEANLFAALHDIPTLTELAVLVLYAQAVSHPYMRKVRGPGTEQINMLNMGPLHDEVKVHVQTIIDNPNILASNNTSYKNGALHGEKWHQPAAVAAVLKLSSELPYLLPVLVAFFGGAMITWERFTTEFAPGSPIDLASAEDKERAWMPPTNDVNEGALGSYRLYIRKKPTTTIEQYNALTMFNFNNTEDFMTKCFTPEDHKFIREEARAAEHNKGEKKIREELRLHAAAKADAARQKATDTAAKLAKKVADLAAVERIEDEEVIKGMSKPGLKNQLQLYRQLGVPDIPKISSIPNKPEMYSALLAAVQWYKSQPQNTLQPPDHDGLQCAADENIQDIIGDDGDSASDLD